jgi:cobalt-zinc-cadmium resistance protein CzcA
MMKHIIYALLIFSCLSYARAQQILTLDEALALARKNNGTLQAAGEEMEAQRSLKKTTVDLPKTSVSLLMGQYNSYAKNDNNVTVMQTIPFTVFGGQGSLNRSQLRATEWKRAATEHEVVFQVKQTYYALVYWREQKLLLLRQDSLLDQFYKAASLRHEQGEGSLLEKTTANLQSMEIKNRMHQAAASYNILRRQWQSIIGSETLPDIGDIPLQAIDYDASFDSLQLQQNPTARYWQEQVTVARDHKKVERAKAAPDLMLGFFSQTLIDVVDTESGDVATSSDRFTGFQIGLAIPLWFAPHHGRVRAAEHNRRAAEQTYIQQYRNLQTEYAQAWENKEKNEKSFIYFRDSAMPQANLMERQAKVAFRAGEIGYVEFLLTLQKVMSVREQYLQAISEYNQSILYLQLMTGQSL